MAPCGETGCPTANPPTKAIHCPSDLLQDKPRIFGSDICDCEEPPKRKTYPEDPCTCGIQMYEKPGASCCDDKARLASYGPPHHHDASGVHHGHDTGAPIVSSCNGNGKAAAGNACNGSSKCGDNVICCGCNIYEGDLVDKKPSATKCNEIGCGCDCSCTHYAKLYK